VSSPRPAKLSNLYKFIPYEPLQARAHFVRRFARIRCAGYIAVMALQDDWLERKNMWSNCSPGGKIFLAVSFVLSCALVSSLVDQILQFQGFILGAIEFCRIPFNYVVDALNNYWGLVVKRSTVEMFVLNSLLAASYSKALNVYFKPTLTRYVFIVVYVLFVTILDYQDWSLENAPRPDNLPYYFYAVLLASFFIGGFLIPGQTVQTRQTVRIHRLAVGYILTILLFVGAIAAISEGLTRPL
jgi:hypothetical protein